MSNPPQNFYFYNMVKNRTGANWKLNKSTGRQIIMEKAPMNLRPGVNKFAGLEYKGNDFAARPLKALQKAIHIDNAVRSGRAYISKRSHGECRKSGFNNNNE